MILLISSETDITTNIVVRWLLTMHTSFFRLNTENQSNLNHFKIDSKGIELKIKDIDFSKVTIVWHRRGRLRHLPVSLSNLGNTSTYLKKEEDSLIKSIENYLKTKVPYIGSYVQEAENYKLEYLIEAINCNLLIPHSLVTTSKKELIAFKKKHKRIITKDIRYPVHIKTKNALISSVGTILVNNKMINTLNENFAPIYLQEYIEKQYEIRVFFFDSKLYSMAIFSQNDSQTAIDFRNYNDKMPNRCVPINLNKTITNKLLRFIKKVKLNTGSIDLIYSLNGDYIFLEVNPMGQFDWLSRNCNYYIEREIAQNLIRVSHGEN